MVSFLGDGNKYIVVSADSSLADAENIRQFVSCYLSKRCLDSTSFTYENIKNGYNAFDDENEMLARFLDYFDGGIGFQNIFWIFLLTPNAQSKQLAIQQCDQQIWLRIGKIISQLILKAATYRNQISFWAQKGMSLKSEQILGERIREYGTDFEVFANYIDSAERRIAQLRSNLKICIPHNKQIVEIVPLNITENTLINDFNNNLAALKQFINVLEMQQISYDEIITTVKKENKTVARATWLVEISIPQGNENGGT